MARHQSMFTFDSMKTVPVRDAATATATAKAKATGPTRPLSNISSAPKGSVENALGVIPSDPRYQKIVRMQNIFLVSDDDDLIF